MPPMSTVISGAVSVSNWALSTQHFLADTAYFGLLVVCGNHRPSARGTAKETRRFAPETPSVRPGEKNADSATGILRRLLDTGAATQDNQVGDEPLSPDCALLNGFGCPPGS